MPVKKRSETLKITNWEEISLTVYRGAETLALAKFERGQVAEPL
jgi:hypothetical protein